MQTIYAQKVISFERVIMRTYYIKDGKEISEYFSAKNEWVNSPKSFMQREKDIYYIDVIENTQAYYFKCKRPGILI